MGSATEGPVNGAYYFYVYKEVVGGGCSCSSFTIHQTMG